jgi:hypothetical protein
MNRGKILEYLLRQRGYCGSGWPNTAAAQGGKVVGRPGLQNEPTEGANLRQVTIGLVLERSLSPIERAAYLHFILAKKGEEISTIQKILACSRSTAYRRLRQIEIRLTGEFRKCGLIL